MLLHNVNSGFIDGHADQANSTGGGNSARPSDPIEGDGRRSWHQSSRFADARPPANRRRGEPARRSENTDRAVKPDDFCRTNGKPPAGGNAADRNHAAVLGRRRRCCGGSTGHSTPGVWDRGGRFPTVADSRRFGLSGGRRIQAGGSCCCLGPFGKPRPDPALNNAP